MLLSRNIHSDEAMPQTVPSAGFTPPCDYSNFAEYFDLSLLPGGDQPVSPSTLLYAQTPPPLDIKKQPEPKIFATFYPNSPEQEISDDLEFRPDFQKLLDSETDSSNSNIFPQSPVTNIYLEVPQNNFQSNSSVGSLSPYSTQSLLSPNDQFNTYRQSCDTNFYPSSPELSLYSPSPNSVYSVSPCDDYFKNQYIKGENPVSTSPLPPFSPFQIKEESYLSPCGFSSPTSPASTSYSSLSSPDQINIQPDNPDVLNLLERSVLDKQIKQESTVDFGSILQDFQDNTTLRALLENNFQKPKVQEVQNKPKDHQLLREVLRDTSFQEKFNIKPLDFGFIGTQIKMEEPDESTTNDLMTSCGDQITRENIEPVLNLAIQQMRKDVDTTCSALGISPDPQQWNSSNVLSWVQWTSREFSLPEPSPEHWDITGPNLLALTEEEFFRKSPMSGMILHAQLEIWKATSSNDELNMQWLPETASSNASSGDISEDEEEESKLPAEVPKPTTSKTGSHIHLWQFLKELLATSQVHGSCIRWLDRTKGIFKIEDSVKVARLWGKRKNRPAMNYDKLSRSIRQYYKKGIMKKTERSQRLVYQFCHPYSL